MNKVHLNQNTMNQLRTGLAVRVLRALEGVSFRRGSVNFFGVPRGGVAALYLVESELIRILGHRWKVELVDDPSRADFFIDDIVDSGRTKESYLEKYPLAVGFDALVCPGDYDSWVVFPWERNAAGEDAEGLSGTVTRLLEYIGEDPTREGLLETPHRVEKAYATWFGGYSKKPEDVLKVFTDGAEHYAGNESQMVVVKDIPFYSHCEHHMAPFFGTATVAYIPDGQIVGLSKMSRLVDVFARRLQVQERLTTQIADAINEVLKPKGVAVLLKARHMCMESRGVQQQGSETVTNALRGVFLEEGTARAEFMQLASK